MINFKACKSHPSENEISLESHSSPHIGGYHNSWCAEMELVLPVKVPSFTVSFPIYRAKDTSVWTFTGNLAISRFFLVFLGKKFWIFIFTICFLWAPYTVVGGVFCIVTLGFVFGPQPLSASAFVISPICWCPLSDDTTARDLCHPPHLKHWIPSNPLSLPQTIPFMDSGKHWMFRLCLVPRQPTVLREIWGRKQPWTVRISLQLYLRCGCF